METIPREVVQDRLHVFFHRHHHPNLYDHLMERFAKAGMRLKPSHYVLSNADVQLIVKTNGELGLVREGAQLDTELATRGIHGASIQIRTALINAAASTRPSIPLLAHRISELCPREDKIDPGKRPIGRVAHIEEKRNVA